MRDIFGKRKKHFDYRYIVWCRETHLLEVVLLSLIQPMPSGPRITKKIVRFSFQNLSFNLFKIPYREVRDHFALYDWENAFSSRRKYRFVNTVKSFN
jgi:hypothetical protein